MSIVFVVVVIDAVVSDAAVIDAEFELVGNAVVVEGGAVEIIKKLEKIRLINKRAMAL